VDPSTLSREQLLAHTAALEARLAAAEADRAALAAALAQAQAARERAEAKLRQQQRTLDLYREVPAGVFSVPIGNAPDGRFVSGHFEQITGYSVDEFAADPLLWDRLLHPDDAAYVHAADRQAAAAGTRASYEYRIRHRDGHWVWVHEETDIVRDEGTGDIFARGFFFNVTARKAAEGRVRAQEELYRSFFENIPDVINRVDREGRTLYVSQNVERYTGVSPETHIGRTALELGMPPDIYTQFARAYEALFATMQPQSFDFSPVAPDGVRHFEARIIPEFGPDGTVATALVISRDVTEQRRAEAALRESEERLRTILSGMPVMLDAFDEQRRLMVWNAECERVTGYSAEEMLGRDDVISRLYPDPDYRESFVHEWQRRGSNFRNWELTITRKDGERRVVAWSNVSEELPVPGWLFWAIGVDVTEQRRAEAALRESESRLRLALDAASMVAWEWDIRTGRTIWIGDPDRALQVRGATDSTLSDVLTRLVPPEDLAIVQQAFKRIKQAGEVRTEHRYLRADGSLGWNETYARIARWDGGAPATLVGVSRAITGRKEMEAELRRREQQFSALVEHSPDVIFRHRIVPDLAYEYVSPAIVDLVGYPPEAFLADPLFLTRIVHPDDLPTVERMNSTLQAPQPFVLRLRRHDGQYLWIELNTSAVHGDDGTVVAYEGVFHDITAHKLLEQTLRRQAGLQAMLLNSLRLLHGHGHDEAARERILAGVAAELCEGVAAANVQIYTVEDGAAPALRLIALADHRGALPAPRHTIPVDAIPQQAQLLGSTPPAPQDAVKVPAFAPAAGDNCCYYLFNLGWRQVVWGLVAVGVAPGVSLDPEQLTLAATVVEMAATTTRRWLAVDALQEGERRLRLAVEAAQLGTWELDLDAERITLSEKNARMMGLGAAEMTVEFAQISAVMHPDDLAMIADGVQRTIDAGEQLRLQVRVLHPELGLRWVQVLGQALTDNGAPKRIFGLVLDNTAQIEAAEAIRRLNADLERRVEERTFELERANQALRAEIADRERAELALRDSQRFLERLLAAFPGQLYVFDYHGHQLIYSNKSLPSMLNYPAELDPTFGSFPISTLMHPEDYGRLPVLYELYETISDDAVVENEFRLLAADGGWRWFASRDIVFSRSPGGQPEQMLGISIEVTARKQAESELADTFAQLDALNSELRRSDSLLRTIINSLDDALALIGVDGRVLMVNRSLTALCGLEAAAIVGAPWRAICPFDSPAVEQALQDALAFSGRERFVRDGVGRTLDVQVIPLSASGAARQLVLHLVDVTERLQFEELALKNERLAATGRLAAIVAHEVNSPLQAIQNFLYLAASDDREERDRNLAMVASEIDRIGGLIRRLLDLQRPGDDVLRVLDANALLDKVLAVTSSTMGRHRVQVSRQLAAEPLPVQGRADQLTQVLLNLVLNALDAMPHGGALAIRSGWSRLAPGDIASGGPLHAVEIEVADTGHGIPEGILARIFDPFFTTKSSGSGLGLAISRQIVEQHGGRLLARNRRPRGACFTITLPPAGPGDG
jgi:PAS domain S-box-containing protein